MTQTETRPKLSIVMPVFNNLPLVRVMIDGILANDYTDYELIVVDDGSDNETWCALQSYATAVGNRPEVKVVHRGRGPKGAPTCRNVGFDMARGDYVMFFDSDDYVTSTCLATRVGELEKRPDLDFMVFPSGIYDERGFHTEAHLLTFGYPIYKDDLASFAGRWLPFVVWNNIYRTASLRHHGVRWDENLLSYQDADFNVSTLIAGMRYDYARTMPDYGYRITTVASVSKKTFSKEHFNSHAHSVRNMYDKVQAKYGHRYNRALFSGVCYLYNTLMTGEGLNRELATVLCESIADKDPLRSRILKMCARLSHILEHIMPAKTARQLPMLPFLLGFRAMHRTKIKRLQRIGL